MSEKENIPTFQEIQTKKGYESFNPFMCGLSDQRLDMETILLFFLVVHIFICMNVTNDLLLLFLVRYFLSQNTFHQIKQKIAGFTVEKTILNSLEIDNRVECGGI